MTRLVDNTLVVDEPDVLLQHSVQQGHIGLLRFDRVREEAVRFAGNKCVDRHLFNAKDNACIADIFANHGSSIQVGL